MQGLQALMQRGMMPGQAGAFSALPQQQGKNPIAYTASLKQLRPEQLLSMYNDPNDLRPKWAVASAYADAVKAKALNQGAEGQGAMAQNAQQQRPVVDEVMSIPLAMGGQIKSYALGGDIESNDLSNVVAQLSPFNADFGTPGISADQLATEREVSRREQIRERYRNALLGGFDGTIEKLFREEPWLQAEMRPSEVKTAPSQQPSGGAREPDAPPKVLAAPGPSAGQTSGLSAAQAMVNYRKLMEDQYKTLTEEMRKSEKEPEDIKTGRQRVADLRSAQIQQAQEDARRIRETGVARLQQSLDRAKEPIINDPRALFAIAASINPEKGKLFSSLSRGIQDVLTEREARAEKAEQGIETLSEKIRLLNAQYREAQALEEERQQALRVKNYEKARDLEIRIQQIGFDMRKTQATLQIGEMEAGAKREEAASRSGQVDTANEANRLAKLQMSVRDKQIQVQNVVEANNKKYDNIYKLAGLAGADEKRKAAAKQAQDELRQQLAAIDAAFDPGINSLRAMVGLPAINNATNFDRWGRDVKVTETPKQ
jgi:hypothetical protein